MNAKANGVVHEQLGNNDWKRFLLGHTSRGPMTDDHVNWCFDDGVVHAGYYGYTRCGVVFTDNRAWAASLGIQFAEETKEDVDCLACVAGQVPNE